LVFAREGSLSALNKKIQDYHSYSGIIHVHSTYSDGHLSVPEIAAIADELKLDFLLLTDHNTLQAKFDGLEGWYGDVLLGVGCEINDVQDQNHYLSFNIDEVISSDMPPEKYVCRVRDLGGFGIIAHPDESRSRMPQYPAYPWKIWDSECFDGIEIWNQMSEWMEGLTPFNKYYRVMHPRRSIVAPKSLTLERWDQLNLKRKIVGIGGVDAHEHVYQLLGGLIKLRIFRYKVSFKTIRTHILVPDPLAKSEDYRTGLERVYSALRNANCYVSHYYFGDASSFRFWAKNKTGHAIIGESLEFKEDTRLFVQNPKPAITHMILNGKIIEKKEGQNIAFDVESPGNYRVETHIDQRPWIISNHIRIH